MATTRQRCVTRFRSMSPPSSSTRSGPTFKPSNCATRSPFCSFPTLPGDPGPPRRPSTLRRPESGRSQGTVLQDGRPPAEGLVPVPPKEAGKPRQESCHQGIAPEQPAPGTRKTQEPAATVRRLPKIRRTSVAAVLLFRSTPAPVVPAAPAAPSAEPPRKSREGRRPQ